MCGAVWAPVVGGLVGGLIVIAGPLVLECYKSRRRNKLDALRIDLLKKMLSDQRFDWRNLGTLSHIIGADEETTKRLLIEVGARASEDGQPLWALVSRQPFPNVQ